MKIKEEHGYIKIWENWFGDVHVTVDVTELVKTPEFQRQVEAVKQLRLNSLCYNKNGSEVRLRKFTDKIPSDEKR